MKNRRQEKRRRLSIINNHSGRIKGEKKIYPNCYRTKDSEVSMDGVAQVDGLSMSVPYRAGSTTQVIIAFGCSCGYSLFIHTPISPSSKTAVIFTSRKFGPLQHPSFPQLGSSLILAISPGTGIVKTPRTPQLNTEGWFHGAPKIPGDHF